MLKASLALPNEHGPEAPGRREFLGLDRKALEAITEQTVHDALAAVRVPLKAVPPGKSRR